MGQRNDLKPENISADLRQSSRETKASEQAARVTGGPQDGQWFWSVLVDAQGRPWNSGTGNAASGAEAKAAAERNDASRNREIAARQEPLAQAGCLVGHTRPRLGAR